MKTRRPMTMIERLIVMAILGILAAIVLPSLQQAKESARGSASPAVEEPAMPDGQLNTIDVSEASGGADHTSRQDWGRTIRPVLPMAVILAIILMRLRHLQRQKSRRAQQ